MSNIKIEAFHIIGISIKTSNDHGQSGKDIPNLWNKFMSEKIMEQIPNKVDGEIYCVYTNYEGDYTKPYTTLLGCKVSDLDQIPDGFTGMTFSAAQYQKFVSKGDVTKGAIWNTWLDIWNENLDRTFIADFEVYGERASNPQDAEVDIYVSVKA